MCLFPFLNNNRNSTAYKKGVKEFECGACPECLSKRSKQWALRAVAQAQVSPSVMVCLTYDEYIHDTNTGRIIGERVSPKKCNKEDVQKFIKRLRRYIQYHFGQTNVKYLVTAEYGKRTHRAHYHALLFNVQFTDLVPYKRSKRGNLIYKSATLDKIWQHGICTVDSVNVQSACARYCTKYAMKDKEADTFMLFSRGIGEAVLMRDFNGISYIYDGFEYPIPRQIWRNYIENKYNIHGFSRYRGLRYCDDFFNYKPQRLLDKANKKKERLFALFSSKERNMFYRRKWFDYVRSRHAKNKKVSFKTYELIEYYNRIIENIDRRINEIYSYCAQLEYRANSIIESGLRINDRVQRFTADVRLASAYARKNRIYRDARDNDELFQNYIAYWANKAALYDDIRPNALTRILQLDNGKYFSYKQKALKCYSSRLWHKNLYGETDGALPPPRSNCISRYLRYTEKYLPLTPLVHKRQMTQTNEQISKLRDFLRGSTVLLYERPWKNENENPFIPALGQISMENL